MKAARYLSLTLTGVALLGANHVLADDLPLPADPAQQRETMRSLGAEERTAYREQMQERMRTMTPEEQKLMRETSVDGRARLENRQAAQGDGTRRGKGYGQGYESRRGDGSGGGRSMGGGRHR